LSQPFKERHSRFRCPSCGAQSLLRVNGQGVIIVTLEFGLPAIPEESPEGDIRPDGLPKGVDAQKARKED
jgi:hypothetical protein